jgi:hypothetical protein
MPVQTMRQIKSDALMLSNFNFCFHGTFLKPVEPKVGNVLSYGDATMVHFYCRYLGYLYIDRNGHASPRELVYEGGGNNFSYICPSCGWFIRINLRVGKAGQKAYVISNMIGGKEHDEDRCFPSPLAYDPASHPGHLSASGVVAAYDPAGGQPSVAGVLSTMTNDPAVHPTFVGVLPTASVEISRPVRLTRSNLPAALASFEVTRVIKKRRRQS